MYSSKLYIFIYFKRNRSIYLYIHKIYNIFQIGLLNLAEFSKGTESVTSVNLSHEDLVNFVLDPSDITLSVRTVDLPKGPLVTQDYTVTAAVLPVFQTFGLR